MEEKLRDKTVRRGYSINKMFKQAAKKSG